MYEHRTPPIARRFARACAHGALACMTLSLASAWRLHVLEDLPGATRS